MGVARVGVGRADADDIVLYFLRMLTRLWILDWTSRGALYNNIDLISMDLHECDARPETNHFEPLRISNERASICVMYALVE